MRKEIRKRFFDESSANMAKTLAAKNELNNQPPHSCDFSRELGGFSLFLQDFTKNG